MAKRNDTPTEMLKRILALAGGVPLVLPAGQTTLVIEGTVIPAPQFVTELNGYAALWQDAIDTGVVHQKAVAKRDAAAPKVKARLDAGEAAVKEMMGKSNPDLTKAGIKPAKAHAKLSAAAQAKKNAASKATREARHTMGSKQKKAVKGVVPPPKV